MSQSLENISRISFSVNAEAFTFREFIDYLKSLKMKSTIIDEASSILSELEKMNYSSVGANDTGLSKSYKILLRSLKEMFKTIFAVITFNFYDSYGDKLERRTL